MIRGMDVWQADAREEQSCTSVVLDRFVCFSLNRANIFPVSFAPCLLLVSGIGCESRPSERCINRAGIKPRPVFQLGPSAGPLIKRRKEKMGLENVDVEEVSVSSAMRAPIS